MRKQFYFPNMLPKIQKYIEACALCQQTKPKNIKQRPYYGRIPIEYIPCENLAVDLKKMVTGILAYCDLRKDEFCTHHPFTKQANSNNCRCVVTPGVFLNRPTNKSVNRPGLTINISSYKRTVDKPGMYNANNKSKSRKTNSNNW